jgi:hypothetical protein|tara:strand:- start:420 stop:836 length:417 start_codon:yes stop_codon:yes gene_type:complete
MGIDATINGQHGKVPIVSDYGELIVAPVSYSSASVQLIDVIDTGYVFVPPIAGKKIVITGVILSTDKDVSTTIGSAIEIYESTDGSGTTVESSILQVDLIKQKTLVIQGINVITSEGRWVMGKASDDDVKISLYYYYI